MKTIQKFALASVAAVVLLGAAGCENMSHREKSMAVGAGAGAVGGAVLTGGSALGTVGGAAVGGVIGNEVGKNKK
ncbi:lipoprotein [compost metagenome]|jgi:osmotically inducible lipoprotein OsmB